MARVIRRFTSPSEYSSDSTNHEDAQDVVFEDMPVKWLADYAKSQNPPIDIGNATSAAGIAKKIRESQVE